jgi:hypothetical protein
MSAHDVWLSRSPAEVLNLPSFAPFYKHFRGVTLYNPAFYERFIKFYENKNRNRPVQQQEQVW